MVERGTARGGNRALLINYRTVDEEVKHIVYSNALLRRQCRALPEDTTGVGIHEADEGLILRHAHELPEEYGLKQTDERQMERKPECPAVNEAGPGIWRRRTRWS